MITDEFLNSPPILRLNHPVFQSAGITVDVRRLDLLHPEINGNKWYKLKYNLIQAIESHHKTILTFGGAWSNHIHATASAGKLFGVKTIGVIRGEEPPHWSDTLQHAKACGMQLEFITRLAYEEKNTEDFVGWLHETYGAFHLVPEGGSNYAGINGCMEIVTSDDKNNYNIIATSCGTGATLAGILMASGEQQHAIGFSSLKNGSFLADEVIGHIKKVLGDPQLAFEYSNKFHIETDYHFGGYGKWNEELLQFIKKMEMEYNLPLDQVYTGKMMYGLIDLARLGKFERGSRVLAIHTGGLQGRDSLT